MLGGMTKMRVEEEERKEKSGVDMEELEKVKKALFIFFLSPISLRLHPRSSLFALCSSLFALRLFVVILRSLKIYKLMF